MEHQRPRYTALHPEGSYNETKNIVNRLLMDSTADEVFILQSIRDKVDPETLAPVAPGEVGVLRLDDPANLDSVCAVQTSDLARRVEGGIALIGRAAGAVPRGCSLAIEEAMSGRADV